MSELVNCGRLVDWLIGCWICWLGLKVRVRVIVMRRFGLGVKVRIKLKVRVRVIGRVVVGLVLWLGSEFGAHGYAQVRVMVPLPIALTDGYDFR